MEKWCLWCKIGESTELCVHIIVGALWIDLEAESAILAGTPEDDSEGGCAILEWPSEDDFVGGIAILKWFLSLECCSLVATNEKININLG